MGLKKTIAVSGEVTTTDNTFTTVASYDLTDNCSFSINFSIVGRDDANSQMTSAQGCHRGRRVSGTITLVGSIVYLVTHNTGSDNGLSTTSSRVFITGNTIQLMVRGLTSRTIQWNGIMELTLN